MDDEELNQASQNEQVGNQLQHNVSISTTACHQQHSSRVSSSQEASESEKRINVSRRPRQMISAADFNMSPYCNAMNPVLPDTLYSAPLGNTVQFEQNLYQQSLSGVTKMVTSAPTSSISSDETLGDSSTTSSSVQFQYGG
jgi:maltoporin